MADNFAILGPGRTGSGVILRALIQLYKFNKTICKDVSPHTLPRYIEKNEIVHSHTLDWLPYISDKTQLIVSTRDPVESALSWCIQPRLYKWHFYNSDEKLLSLLKIKKFYLEPSEFLKWYEVCIRFYENFRYEGNYVLLDYADWCDKPDQILKMIGYDFDIDKSLLPIKNPGTHREWIENYDEICSLANTLDRRVLIPKTFVACSSDKS